MIAPPPPTTDFPPEDAIVLQRQFSGSMLKFSRQSSDNLWLRSSYVGQYLEHNLHESEHVYEEFAKQFVRYLDSGPVLNTQQRTMAAILSGFSIASIFPLGLKKLDFFVGDAECQDPFKLYVRISFALVDYAGNFSLTADWYNRSTGPEFNISCYKAGKYKSDLYVGLEELSKGLYKFVDAAA